MTIQPAWAAVKVTRHAAALIGAMGAAACRKEAPPPPPTPEVAVMTVRPTTVEDEVVFAPGINGEQRPLLIAPSRRSFRSGSLLRLLSGDLGVGFSPRPGAPLVIVSLTTGERAEGFDLVFERWSLALRRGDKETLLGHFKITSPFAEERRHP